MRRVALVMSGSRRVNKRTCRFVESLRDSGFEPVLLAIPRRSWETSGIEDPTLVARQGFVTLRSGNPRPRLPQRPHVIVCMHWSVLPLATLLKLVLRVRVIYDEHDHYEMLALEAGGPAWLNRVRSRLVRRIHAWCLPRVDAVTCIRLAGSLLQRHLQSLAPTVIELHNYPSRRWAAPLQSQARSAGPIALVYVGGIWDVKGCRTMLESFLLIADEQSYRPVALHVFGRGDPDIELQLRTSPGVTFHGTSGYSAIVEFLVSSDCIGLVLLEATPRYNLVSTNCHKLYEYMATGTPVLATNVGEMSDIVSALDGGWTITSELDAELLASTVREIISNPHELRRRGDAAAAAVARESLWWEDEWRKLEGLGVLDV